MRWLIWGLLTFACTTPSPQRGPANVAVMNDDERLIARVREAAQTGISVAAVEAAVGTPATFTTARQSLEIMRHADLVPDPDHRSDPWIHEEVVGAAYWTRPVATHNPRVVGIVYAKDGSTKVFFAEVYPP